MELMQFVDKIAIYHIFVFVFQHWIMEKWQKSLLIEKLQ